MKKLAALLFSALLLLAGPLAAAELSSQDVYDLQRVEAYMNAMPPVRADFIQQTSDGQVYNGQFWLQRPGRLRFEYDNPVNNFVVADGAFIHFWDAKMKQQTSAPIGETLADFILQKNIRFDQNVQVTGITRQAGILMISVVQASDPGAGTLTLIFEDMPLQLKQWSTADATGRVSNVSLVNPATAAKFDPRLFSFRAP
ncbi:MAG TPA: outer membrane lipoprotein carrier protein LolA [Alphaproteobacteria bacterium]|nr:outer membrane lipoprotein carrier protein LolA [Alphaproteobacteria bacterium]